MRSDLPWNSLEHPTSNLKPRSRGAAVVPAPAHPRACPERSRRSNLNALKSGRYSKRLKALSAALDAMPLTADVLAKMTGRDRRKMEMLAHGLQSYAEMLLLIARGGSIDDLAVPQLRKRALYAIPIKQSAIAPDRNRRGDRLVAQSDEATAPNPPAAGSPQ